MECVSIIIPVYNAQGTIVRCVSSVLSQDYPEKELILVDDGSNDDSSLLCDSFKDSAGITVVHKQNGGVSSARNAGLNIASGEYVMFLDSDDYMLPDMIRKMVDVVGLTKSDLVVCGCVESDGNKWALGKDTIATKEDIKRNLTFYLNTELLSPPWNKIYKKELIVSQFNESSSFGEDFCFNLDYLNQCKTIAFIKESLLYHEVGNTNSLVNKVYPMRLHEIEKYAEKLSIFTDPKRPITEIFGKYLRDITVYSRLLYLNENMQRKELRLALREWHVTALIKKIPILRYHSSISTKTYLLCLKYGFFNIPTVYFVLRKIIKN